MDTLGAFTQVLSSDTVHLQSNLDNRNDFRCQEIAQVMETFRLQAASRMGRDDSRSKHRIGCRDLTVPTSQHCGLASRMYTHGSSWNPSHKPYILPMMAISHALVISGFQMLVMGGKCKLIAYPPKE